MAGIATGQRSASPQQKGMGASEASSGGSFAFLVHSQDTLNNNLPPNVDNQPLARQKRRRTSPQDHAILEAEYEKNSKPDKAARLVIVNRVALGEKEVQIWFQNRRQIARRKSRPFYSQESGLSDMFSSQESTATTACSSFSLPELVDEHLSSQSSVQQSQTIVDTASSMPVGELWERKIVARDSVTDDTPSEISAANVSVQPGKKIDASIVHTTDLQTSSKSLSFPSVKHTASTKYRPGPAFRRNSSFIIHHDGAKSNLTSAVGPHEAPVKARGATSLPSTLRRSSSLLKLSTSFDGKAKVITGSESPSPPKIRAPRPVTGLQRSQSAIEPSRKPCDEVPSHSFRSPKRLMTGRSRDARTWEFYCDSDVQDALTQQAKREQSGSATSAIGLIRSRGNTALASNSNKRNPNVPKLDSLKRSKADEIKPQKRKLDRTTSSVARLQTTGSSKQAFQTAPRKPKPSSQYDLLVDPGDSDKENWEPGTQTRTQRRRRPANTANHASKVQSVLKESLHIPSQSTSLDAFLDRNNDSSPLTDQENAAGQKEIEEGTDLASGGGLGRETDDLDCVQNLLSLRQGCKIMDDKELHVMKPGSRFYCVWESYGDFHVPQHKPVELHSALRRIVED
ncbi:MAG: hypothetical protein Q9195_004425 [Heterodermia aff. obscurata]